MNILVVELFSVRELKFASENLPSSYSLNHETYLLFKEVFA